MWKSIQYQLSKIRENNTGGGQALPNDTNSSILENPQFGRVSGYCEKVWLADLAECTKYDWLM